MKILLINPGNPGVKKPDHSGGPGRGLIYRFKIFSKAYFAVPLALPTLAALTPKPHKVQIVDEMVEPIPFDEPVDLVGITGMSFKAPRAYQIANEYRKRGIPVVIGGIHASMCPEEAAQYATSVVIGEADEIWPRVVQDAEAGRLRPFYQAERYTVFLTTLDSFIAPMGKVAIPHGPQRIYPRTAN